MKTIKDLVEFEWDKGNIGKNTKHGVEDKAAEEVFFDKHRFIFKDEVHSQQEERLRILGKTKKGRLLFVVFTKRGAKIRVISARDINNSPYALSSRAKRGISCN